MTNTFEHTQTNTHTHQLPQMVSRLVEDQDSPLVRKDFRTKLKTQTQRYFLKVIMYLSIRFVVVARAEDGATRVFHHRLGRVQSLFSQNWPVFFKGKFPSNNEIKCIY